MRQKYWSDLPFPPPVGCILSEVETLWSIHLWWPWHSMAYTFNELQKPVHHDKARLLRSCHLVPSLHGKTLQISAVQSLNRVRLSATPWTAAHQASLSITNSRSLLKLMSIESVMPSNHLILCCPFLLLPSIFPTIRVFSVSSSHQVAKHQSFQWILRTDLLQDGLVGSPCSPSDSQESSPKIS